MTDIGVPLMICQDRLAEVRGTVLRQSVEEYETFQKWRASFPAPTGQKAYIVHPSSLFLSISDLDGKETLVQIS